MAMNSAIGSTSSPFDQTAPTFLKSRSAMVDEKRLPAATLPTTSQATVVTSRAVGLLSSNIAQLLNMTEMREEVLPSNPYTSTERPGGNASTDRFTESDVALFRSITGLNLTIKNGLTAVSGDDASAPPSAEALAQAMKLAGSIELARGGGGAPHW